MIAEIAAGIASLNNAVSLVKALDATKTNAAVGEVKVELTQRIFEAQQALLTAQEAQTMSAARIRELEQKVVDFENWKREQQRYELIEADVGAYAYAHKRGMENGEPPHWLCANCFKNQPSLLQLRGGVEDRIQRRGLLGKWGCNTCGDHILVAQPRSPSDRGAPPVPEPPPAGIKSDYDPYGSGAR